MPKTKNNLYGQKWVACCTRKGWEEYMNESYAEHYIRTHEEETDFNIEMACSMATAKHRKDIGGPQLT